MLARVGEAILSAAAAYIREWDGKNNNNMCRGEGAQPTVLSSWNDPDRTRLYVNFPACSRWYRTISRPQLGGIVHTSAVGSVVIAVVEGLEDQERVGTDPDNQRAKD